MQTVINEINKITIDEAISLGLIEMVGCKYPDSRGSMNIIGEDLNNAALKYTESHAGVLRGLHWQNLKSPQKKIISVGRGKVTLFLLKINKVEPSKVLNAIEINENTGWFLVKENFAHGYLSMDDSIFYYLTQGQYDEKNEKVFTIRDIVMKEWDFLDIITSTKDT
tara:strand:- start:22 stop:519 length:498 start_codon:yes stop_codon:yes gene_type:complete